MIAVWIVGVLFFTVGLMVGLPTCVKLVKCKEYTTGKIVSVDHSSDKNARAVYEYVVADSKYTNRTNWTPHHIFRQGGACHVMYDKNKPSASYIKQSGQFIRCVIGILFAVIGLAAFLLGMVLSRVL